MSLQLVLIRLLGIFLDRLSQQQPRSALLGYHPRDKHQFLDKTQLRTQQVARFFLNRPLHLLRVQMLLVHLLNPPHHLALLTFLDQQPVPNNLQPDQYSEAKVRSERNPPREVFLVEAQQLLHHPLDRPVFLAALLHFQTHLVVLDRLLDLE